MEERAVVNLGKFGMRLGTHPSQLNEHEYTFSLNSNVEDFNGNGLPNLQVEPSNLLCYNLPMGSTVIGYKRDIVNDRTYFFLTNPVTEVSEIGYVDKVIYINTIEDIQNNCGCSINIDLGEPLENQEQSELCTYYRIIRDTCNKCLNFDIRFPIYTSVLKQEKSGNNLYFTDNLNGPRRLTLDNLEYYLQAKSASCDDGSVSQCSENPLCEDCEDCDECINCGRLEIFRKFKTPCIEIETVSNGGELKQGRYWYLISGCDHLGNELTEFYSMTSGVNIFDKSTQVIDQTLLNKETNLAIKLSIECLDFNFTHYKIVNIQATSLSGDLSFYEVGVFPIDTKKVLHTSNHLLKRTTLENIYKTISNWELSEGMVETNNRLYQYGLTAKQELNLQPAVILMSAFLRWQTGVAREDLYSQPSMDGKFGGYTRNENYVWTIEFSDDEGYTTPEYILTHRPATTTERELVFNGNIEDIEGNSKDVISVLQNAPECGNERNERWQFYNTATSLINEECEPVNVEYTEVTSNSTFSCFIKVDELEEEKELYIVKPDNYTTLKDFINSNKTEFGSGGTYDYVDSPSDWLSNLFNSDYSSLHCELADVLCPGYNNEVLVSSTLYVDDITGISEVDIPKDIGNYIPSSKPLTCNTYKVGSDPTTGKEIDPDGLSGIISTHFGAPVTVYSRNSSSNDSCSNSITIQNGTTGYHLDYLFEGNWEDLKTDINSPIISNVAPSRWFSDKLHRNAIWFEGDFGGDSSKIIELTQGTTCTTNDDLEDNQFLRYSIYDVCPTTGSNPIDSGIFDTQNGLIFSIDRLNYSSDSFYVAIDAPIQDIANLAAVGSGYINPPCECFSIKYRDIEVAGTHISISGLSLYKEEIYTADCIFKIPTPTECDILPYQIGKFGYYESTITYPDNTQLFNARDLNVNSLDIPSIIKSEFESYFGNSTDGNNNYILNEDADLTCKPIRLYKFPGNDIAPLMFDNVALS